MKQSGIRILGIETSCDETAVAVVEDGNIIRSNLVASQIEIHRRFGGVVPEVASRRHIEVIASLTEEALKEAGLPRQEIDAVAVANSPGLIGALLVGVSFAKAYAYGLNKPLIGVNHMEAHIYANFLTENKPIFPAVCLVVSGGHTSLLYMERHREFEMMGETRDDAAGEAFDKVARFLGLGYPGGPAVQNAAALASPGKYHLPRVYLDRNDFEFSFSGLKTAAMNLWNKLQRSGEDAEVNYLAAEFQEALVEVLVEKSINAARQKNVKQILLAGGVAANARLRERITAEASANNIQIHIPALELCTDNAAMVACAGYYQYLDGDFAGLDLNAFPQSGLLVKKACG
ncbi:MAG: tRNA (adenosine(37)-N6)-threonylcarbamoyltransferase complex transferase subunit TsaD [Syntrophomonadaceae bacterium]|nr:tRNA (adenosine(37)-N6)-threonylcarbamoyltransferase complex transferase subunit TsaD [Syntrophomonadaceae bacterium]